MFSGLVTVEFFLVTIDLDGLVYRLQIKVTQLRAEAMSGYCYYKLVETISKLKFTQTNS